MTLRTDTASLGGQWHDDGLAALRETERSGPADTRWMIAAYLLATALGFVVFTVAVAGVLTEFWPARLLLAAAAGPAISYGLLSLGASHGRRTVLRRWRHSLLPPRRHPTAAPRRRPGMKHKRLRVSVEHVRALCAGNQGRTVLVLGQDGLRVVTPDQAFDGVFNQRAFRVLCSRSELLDEGLHIGGDGQLAGPTVAVSTRVAAYLNTVLEEIA
ncbi:hypothetical protein C8D87_1145 [Lentzea atacamensis]|uniref:LytTr DNA-binding domain-containing protein n=1 Tax=Lentzea atacamensis TaxID=531938 RepID=A0ABX9DVR5_9PSEU|nr:hypothetical protein [Lentzea atacamensis]RAS59393.1 hypothetical protein C8D87_1145 [Lentzea atacamensis]